MATSLEDCKEIALECDKNPSLINAVCHVLRYYDACVKLKQIIESGIIGEIVNINHTEPVGFWHFAHSFVRGNWSNEAKSTFSLLAKCCHDIDLLVYWMGEKKRCVKVSSFGSLVHFRKENAPENSTSNCFTCPVESNCPYSTKKIYLNRNVDPGSWPWSVVLDTDIFVLTNSKEDDIEDMLKQKTDLEKIDLLKQCLSHPNSKYGRCVYRCDNDVCDNQVVTMNFDDNSIATLTMIAYSKNTCTRQTKVYGTKGELEWDDAVSSTNIIHTDFLTNKKQVIDAKADTIFTHMPKSAIELNRNIAKLAGHGG
jgi:predicted dehydrogenase